MGNSISIEIMLIRSLSYLNDDKMAYNHPAKYHYTENLIRDPIRPKIWVVNLTDLLL
jgi:hypothetical protein